MAELFASLDGGPLQQSAGKRKANLPRPSTWVKGPGGINPDNRPWEQVSKEYAFVEKMAGIRPRVKGKGYLERFDYWLNSFRYLRAVGRVNCTWARFNEAMEKIKVQSEPQVRRRLARETALPIRKELVAQVAEVHRHLLATVATNGAMGNVTNWQQHIIPTLLTRPGEELAEILGEDLPDNAMPANSDSGPFRLFVPTVRSSLQPGEDLRLKAIVLGARRPSEVTLHWRSMGKGNYKSTPLANVARGVSAVRIGASRIKNDLEYYVTARSADGQESIFPTTAPDINQTIVIMKEK